mmetsp:Transcript_12539/g.18738  ORF Transcript_12539/g.18738 Transcript_12539/m.18738 type:complete len:210 (+) Transcript_12539:804-1433(+)
MCEGVEGPDGVGVPIGVKAGDAEGIKGGECPSCNKDLGGVEINEFDGEKFRRDVICTGAETGPRIEEISRTDLSSFSSCTEEAYFSSTSAISGFNCSIHTSLALYFTKLITCCCVGTGPLKKGSFFMSFIVRRFAGSITKSFRRNSFACVEILLYPFPLISAEKWGHLRRRGVFPILFSRGRRKGGEPFNITYKITAQLHISAGSPLYP